jgi:hypothetical protein
LEVVSHFSIAVKLSVSIRFDKKFFKPVSPATGKMIFACYNAVSIKENPFVDIFIYGIRIFNKK